MLVAQLAPPTIDDTLSLTSKANGRAQRGEKGMRAPNRAGQQQTLGETGRTSLGVLLLRGEPRIMRDLSTQPNFVLSIGSNQPLLTSSLLLRFLCVVLSPFPTGFVFALGEDKGTTRTFSTRDPRGRKPEGTQGKHLFTGTWRPRQSLRTSLPLVMTSNKALHMILIVKALPLLLPGTMILLSWMHRQL